MLRHNQIALLLLPLLLSACPRLPIDFGKDGQAHTAEELLKRVEQVEAQVIGLKGDARLSVDSPQGKGSISLFVAVFHPAYVHIEQLDFFGKPQGVLSTDGQVFGLYDAQAGHFLHGPATPANLGRFLPLVLPPEELTMLLLGRAPRIPYDSATFELDDAKRVYVVRLSKGPVVQRLEIDPISSRVLKSHVDGIQAYDSEFSEVTAFAGATYPKRVVIDSKAAKTHVELVTKDIELNEPPDMTLFEISPPEGVPVIEVDEKGDARAAP
jgi:hypothetical protein